MNNRLLMFTNIFPYPWAESRGRFNEVIHNELDRVVETEVLVPVPFQDFVKNVFSILKYRKSKVTYFPFFYVPGFGRSLNPIFMLLSIIISVVPLIKLMTFRKVFCSWGYPDAPGLAMLSRLLKFDLYIHCLGSDVNVHMTNKVRRRWLNYAFSRSQQIFTVSEDLKHKVIQISPNANVETVYNGVDFNRFTLTQKNNDPELASTKLIYIGNLIQTKGVFELAHAFRELCKSHDIKLTIVGNGPCENDLRDILSSEIVKEKVYFTGALSHSEVAKELSASDCLVLPSYSEGVPNVVMEALASGIPVLATDVGGIPEIVNDKNGILFEPQNKRAIEQAYIKFKACQWVANDIQKSVKSYTWENKINVIIDKIFPAEGAN